VRRTKTAATQKSSVRARRAAGGAGWMVRPYRRGAARARRYQPIALGRRIGPRKMRRDLILREVSRHDVVEGGRGTGTAHVAQVIAMIPQSCRCLSGSCEPAGVCGLWCYSAGSLAAAQSRVRGRQRVSTQVANEQWAASLLAEFGNCGSNSLAVNFSGATQG
jgi:hypothetical protein